VHIGMPRQGKATLMLETGPCGQAEWSIMRIELLKIPAGLRKRKATAAVCKKKKEQVSAPRSRDIKVQRTWRTSRNREESPVCHEDGRD